MGQQWLTVTGGNSYSLEFGGTTTLLGSPYINNSADLTLNGAISDGGAGVIINKTNTGVLLDQQRQPDARAANIRQRRPAPFGNRLTGSTTANLGAGNIYVNPGAQPSKCEAQANINTGLGQQVVLTGTPYAASIFRSVGVFTQAQYQDMIESRRHQLESGPSGFGGEQQQPSLDLATSATVALLRVEPHNGDRHLRCAVHRAGTRQFGEQRDRRHQHESGLSLRAYQRANTDDQPVGRRDRQSRDVGSTTTDVQIGSQAILGPNGNLGTTGFVYFQDQNTYTGQTVIARLMTLPGSASIRR